MKKLLAAVTSLLLFALSSAALADEGSCIQCHESQPGSLGEEPVRQWRHSVHYQHGITCHSCHGGDPTLMSLEAMNPARGFLGVPEASEVPSFCGRCHIGIEADYRDSLHGQALGEGGPECVTCHGSHEVQLATIALINPQDCSRCHDYSRAAELRTVMEQTEIMIVALENELRRLHRQGVVVEILQGSLFALRNDFHRLLHSVDVEKVRRQTAAYRQQLDEVQAEVDLIHAELGQRKLVGGGVVVLLLVAGLLLGLLRRSYRQQE